MNRLQFLKTLGVGVAAAVITPKLLIPKEPASLPGVPEKDYFGNYKDEAKMLHYAHYEEDMPRYTVDQLCMHDLCVDKDLRVWMVTKPPADTIELTALLELPEPNFIDVKRKNFDEYFIIMGNVFSPGTGMPTRR